jgi:hypothetical protein
MRSGGERGDERQREEGEDHDEEEPPVTVRRGGRAHRRRERSPETGRRGSADRPGRCLAVGGVP